MTGQQLLEQLATLSDEKLACNINIRVGSTVDIPTTFFYVNTITSLYSPNKPEGVPEFPPVTTLVLAGERT